MGERVLAVEEQFYLLWPVAVLLLPNQSLMRLRGLLSAATTGLDSFRSPTRSWAVEAGLGLAKRQHGSSANYSNNG